MKLKKKLFISGIAVLSLFLWVGNGGIHRSAWGIDNSIKNVCQEAKQCVSEGKVPVCHRPPGNPSNGQFLCLPEPGARGHFEQHQFDSKGCCDDLSQGKLPQGRESASKGPQGNNGHGFDFSVEGRKNFHAKFGELTQGYFGYADRKSWDFAMGLMGGGDLQNRVNAKLVEIEGEPKDGAISMHNGVVAMMAGIKEMGKKYTKEEVIDYVGKLLNQAPTFQNGENYRMVKEAFGFYGDDIKQKFEDMVTTVSEKVYGKTDVYQDNGIIPLGVVLPIAAYVAGEVDGTTTGDPKNAQKNPSNGNLQINTKRASCGRWGICAGADSPSMQCWHEYEAGGADCAHTNCPNNLSCNEID